MYHYTSVDPFFLLRRNIVIAPIIGQNSDTVGPQNGYPLTHDLNFTENDGGFVFRGQPWAQLNFNIQGFRSGNVNYNPPAGAIPFLMNQETVQALVSINPLRQLTDDNTYLLDRDHSVKDGSLVYESQTFRTKLNYQFTRAWSARVIVEYDTTLANHCRPRSRARRKCRPGADYVAAASRHRGLCRLEQRPAELQPHAVLTPGWIVRSDPAILPRGPDYLGDGPTVLYQGQLSLPLLTGPLQKPDHSDDQRLQGTCRLDRSTALTPVTAPRARPRPSV